MAKKKTGTLENIGDALKGAADSLNTTIVQPVSDALGLGKKKPARKPAAKKASTSKAKTGAARSTAKKPAAKSAAKTTAKKPAAKGGSARKSSK